MSIFSIGRRLVTALSIFFALLLAGRPSYAQSDAIARLVEADFHSTQLFFYPSTLRMLNIQKDPSWNEMVKDVRHLRLVMYDADSFLLAEKANLTAELGDEGFEELLSLRSDTIKAEVYGKYDGDRMQGLAALILQSSGGFIIELDGSVDPMKIYKIAQTGIDLPVLNSYFKDQKEEEERGRKYREFRKSLEEDEKAKQDSLSQSKQDSIK